MKSLVHRFPKWLLAEPFALAFDPKATSERRFVVTLWTQGCHYEIEGSGASIVEAAKAAAKARAKWIL